jgi:hypothetical protein
MRDLISHEVSAPSGGGLYSDVLKGGAVGMGIAALLITQLPVEVLIYSSSLIFYGVFIGATVPVLSIAAEYADVNLDPKPSYLNK